MRMRKGAKEDVWKDERVGAGGKKDCEEGKKKRVVGEREKREENIYNPSVIAPDSAQVLETHDA